MLRKLLATTALACAASAAQAAPLYYEFKWKGFESDGVWQPQATLGGTFKGEDLDGDGIIRTSEISQFGLDYNGWKSLSVLGCPDRYSGDGLVNCGVGGFAFDQEAGTLAFRVTAEWAFSGSVYAYVEWDAPHTFSNLDNDGPDSSYGLRWTDATTLKVVSSVPEPATWAMLAAGMLLTAGAARQRRRR